MSVFVYLYDMDSEEIVSITTAEVGHSRPEMLKLRWAGLRGS